MLFDSKNLRRVRAIGQYLNDAISDAPLRLAVTRAIKGELKDLGISMTGAGTEEWRIFVDAPPQRPQRRW